MNLILESTFRAPEVRPNLYESENSPPRQRWGGRAIKKNGPKAPCLARTGWFVQATARTYSEVDEPPRLRPAKVASRHFIDGRCHPSFAKEGNSGSFCLPRLLHGFG